MKFIFNEFSTRATRFFLYNYNDNDFRIVKVKSCRLPGFELLNKVADEVIDYNDNSIQLASLSRTKRNIRELCLCNNFQYFVTLTVDSEKSDRYTLDVVQSNLKKILHKIKRNNKDFAYLLITEKHKDGAFHFHGLMKNIDDLLLNDNGYLSSDIFSKELGFNSFSKIKDYSKCCNYICKYISKDCIKNSHNQIYISSRGLKKAIKEEFTNIDFAPSFENDYVCIKDFRLSDLSKDELLNFINLKKEK